MKYLLQVNTGSFTHTAADGRAIERQLDKCLGRIEVEKVIYGWSPDVKVNEAIVGYLHKKGIEKYLWLPTFCEIHDAQFAEAFEAVDGAGNQAIDDLCQGESFDFVCQSSDRNLRTATDVYDELTKDLPVEGVFIDRIRYASAANSVRDLYGCWCPRCTARYEVAGVDMEKVRRLSKSGTLSPFMPARRENGVYQYEDPDIDALMRVKRTLITEAAEKLCAHFRGIGKKIGIDTFASGTADFVGQDLPALGAMVDFIKPMVYLNTHAPAGVPYEIGAMGGEIARRIDEIEGAPACSMDAAIEQIRQLMDTGAYVAPGIDVNRIDPICTATPEYVRTYLDRLEEIGCRSVVLAWDAMRMGDDVLDAIASR